MADPIRLGILGLGSVGSALVSILSRDAARIEAACGRRVVAHQAAVRDLSRSRVFPGSVSDDPVAVATSDDVDLLVEVMGGLSPAREAVGAALELGKPVVTANKALVATDWSSLSPAWRGGQLRFEAAVVAGVPVVRAVTEAFVADEVLAIEGILNGTTNYILGLMAEGVAWDDSVADAQAKGFAEADPTSDLSGEDARFKIEILARCAGLPAQVVRCEGIGPSLSGQDGVCKLVARTTPGGVEVGPVWLDADDFLARVGGVTNAVRIRLRNGGDQMLVGPGAGGEATASAVMSDIVSLLR